MKLPLLLILATIPWPWADKGTSGQCLMSNAPAVPSWQACPAGGGGGAPTTVPYWTGAADGTLSAEKDLSALSTGLVINTSGTPSAYAGTSCTNQFPRSLNASGAATCASVADADLANNYSGVGACGANQWASTLNDNGAPTCTQPGFSNLSGTASDAQLANNYSGVGSCTNQFVRGVNDNAAPTCASVSLTADVSGTLPLANGGGLTTATDDNVSIGNGTILQSKALPSCSNATTSKLLYDTSTNAFSCGTDQTSAATRTSIFAQDYNGAGSVGGQEGLCVFTTATATSFTAVGIGTCPGFGGDTGFATAAQYDSTYKRQWVRCTTGNVSANDCGITTGGAFNRSSMPYRAYWNAKSSSDLTSQRAYFGWNDNAGLEALAPTTSATATTREGVWVVYDSSVNGNFWCCSADASNYSCGDMGLAVVASTAYTFTVDNQWTTSGEAKCTVRPFGGSETSTTRTSNLSAGSASGGGAFAIRTLTAATRFWDIGEFTVQKRSVY